MSITNDALRRLLDAAFDVLSRIDDRQREDTLRAACYEAEQALAARNEPTAEGSAASPKNDAQGSSAQGSAQAQDSARLDILAEMLGIDTALVADGGYVVHPENYIDIIAWGEQGGNEDAPEIKRAFRAAIDECIRNRTEYRAAMLADARAMATKEAK
jgi:hypothetical protein